MQDTVANERRWSEHRDRLVPVWPWAILGVAVAYVVAGRLALLLAIPPVHAAAVFPPTGIALAVVLVAGYRIVPGIFLGAFALGLSLAPDLAGKLSWVVAASVAFGATLQSVIGAFLVRRFVGYPNPLDTGRDIILFLVLGGAASCIISSVWCTGTLWLAEILPTAALARNGLRWWIGDTAGVLVFAPLVLVILGRPRPIWRKRLFSLALPLLMAFACIFAVHLYVKKAEQQRVQLEFERHAAILDRTLTHSLDRYLDVLHAIAGFYDASANVVGRAGFRTFAARFFASHPGLQALEWIPRVRDDERDAYVQAARRDAGREDQPYVRDLLQAFTITELRSQDVMVSADRRAEYFPAFYIEPMVGNVAALGFDLASNPTRLAALNAARDTGQLVASARTTLLQESERQYGFLVFAPIYRAGLRPSSVEERRRTLDGFALAVFRVDDIVDAALQGIRRAGIGLRIEDESAGVDTRLLYADGDDGSEEVDLQFTRGYTLGGREWSLRFTADELYAAARRSTNGDLVLGGAAILIGLFSAFLMLVTGRAERVESLVTKRTEELTRANEAHVIANAELERMVHALEVSEARQATVIETAVDGVIVIDAQGAVQLFNASCEAMFGYSADEVVGRNVKMLMPPPYQDEHDGYLNRYHQTGERKIIGIGREVRGRRKDGSTFPMDLAVGEARRKGASTYVGILRDITERKRVEQALESSVREHRDFAYSVAHDLKAPLRAMQGFSEVLIEDYRDTLDESAQGHLGEISAGAARMGRLIDDLLDYSQLGHGEVIYQPVALDDVLVQVQRNLAVEARTSGLIVRTGSLPVIEGQRATLEAVFQNLLSNAIKFVAPGQEPEVDISAVEDEEFHIVAIRDNGIGIEAEYRDRIFEIFQRLHTTSSYPGTGIGLAIVRKGVELHHGTLWLESVFGGGSTFFLRLPKTQPSARTRSDGADPNRSAVG